MLKMEEWLSSYNILPTPARHPAIHTPLRPLDALWLSEHKFHIPCEQSGIAICRVVLVRQLFERLEQDYGTFISGISIPF